MKISSLVIGILWIYLIVDAYRQGQALPDTLAVLPLLKISSTVFTTFIGASFALGLSVTFYTRRRLMEDLPLVTRLVDGRYGAGTYRDFNRRLWPITLSIVSGSLLGGSGLQAVHSTSGNSLGYLICGIFLSLSAGLLFAQLLSLRYPPVLR